MRDTQPAEISLRLGPTKAKDFETSKVFGPSLVTAYELSSVDNLRMTTKVNGEVWFDGELIRKDGIFLPKDLRPLNPQNLK